MIMQMKLSKKYLNHFLLLRGSDFLFDGINLRYYKLYEINFNMVDDILSLG